MIPLNWRVDAAIPQSCRIQLDQMTLFKRSLKSTDYKLDVVNIRLDGPVKMVDPPGLLMTEQQKQRWDTFNAITLAAEEHLQNYFSARAENGK